MQIQNGPDPRVGGLAPIEARVRIEDLQPAHQQQRQREHVDPVRNPNQQAMALVEVLAEHAEPELGAYTSDRVTRSQITPVRQPCSTPRAGRSLVRWKYSAG